MHLINEVVMAPNHPPTGPELIVSCTIFVIVAAIVVGLGWVLPMMLGVRTAQRKNYSPLWMLFGIHPLAGWVAFIVLACLPPRFQCGHCGGFVTNNFRLCPYCHASMESEATSGKAGTA